MVPGKPLHTVFFQNHSGFTALPLSFRCMYLQCRVHQKFFRKLRLVFQKRFNPNVIWWKGCVSVCATENWIAGDAPLNTLTKLQDSHGEIPVYFLPCLHFRFTVWGLLFSLIHAYLFGSHIELYDIGWFHLHSW